MKKYFLPLLFAGILLGEACSSEIVENQPVTPVIPADADYVITLEEAEADLLSILNDKNFQAPTTRSGGERRIADRFSLGSPVPSTRAEGEDTEPYIHIFNFENEEGFAIMSGDERVPSLLALTYGGTLEPGMEIESPGLAIFLSRLEPYFKEQIASANDRQVATRSDDEPSNYFADWGWETTYDTPYNVSPLLGKWTQGAPYNQVIQGYTGRNYLAGCVPVAVGQLMSMYKHPANFYFNFNNYTLHWDGISNPAVPGHASNAGVLLYLLGFPTNLDVDYGTDETGTKPQNIKRTLNNFGYTCSDLTAYNTRTIAQEIVWGYPCLVGAYTERGHILGLITWGKGGHRWVVHGLMTRRHVTAEYDWHTDSPINFIYDETREYLLCNMGWGGIDDGYYVAGVFDTGTEIPEHSGLPTQSGRYNFWYEPTMITGIREN